MLGDFSRRKRPPLRFRGKIRRRASLIFGREHRPHSIRRRHEVYLLDGIENMREIGWYCRQHTTNSPYFSFRLTTAIGVLCTAQPRPCTYLLPTIACCCWWETEGPSSPPSRPWSTTGVPWPVSVSYDHESAPSLVHTCPSRSPGGTTNPIITRCHICNRPASSTPPPLHRLRDHDMYAEPDVHTKRQQQSICAKVLL